MTSTIEIFIFLLLSGMLLIVAEIYLPGGVIGALGALALIGAMVMGFLAFGLQAGFIVAALIILLSGLVLLLWIKFFPTTAMGRKLILSRDTHEYKSSDDWKALAGQQGEALSELRPSGIALIGGKRVDVVADGVWIAAHSRIQVASVEGSIIRVKPVAATAPHPEKA